MSCKDELLNRILGFDLGEYNNKYLEDIVISIINNYKIPTSQFIDSFIKKVNEESFLDLELRLVEDKKIIYVEDKDYHIPCPPVGVDIDIIEPFYKAVSTKKKSIYLYSKALNSNICFSEVKDEAYPGDVLNECIFDSINLSSLDSVKFPDYLKNYFIEIYFEYIIKEKNEIIDKIKNYLKKNIDLLTVRNLKLLNNKEDLLKQLESYKSELKKQITSDEDTYYIERENRIIQEEMEHCDITYDVDNYNLDRDIDLISKKINSFQRKDDKYTIDYFLFWNDNEIGCGVLDYPVELVEIINTYLSYFSKLSISLDDNYILNIKDSSDKNVNINSLISFLNNYKNSIELFLKKDFYDSNFIKYIELNKLKEVINNIDSYTSSLDSLFSIIYENNDNMYDQIINNYQFSFNLHNTEKNNIIEFLSLIKNRINKLLLILDSYITRKEFEVKLSSNNKKMEEVYNKAILKNKLQESVTNLDNRIYIINGEILNNENMLNELNDASNIMNHDNVVKKKNNL